MILLNRLWKISAGSWSRMDYQQSFPGEIIMHNMKDPELEVHSLCSFWGRYGRKYMQISIYQGACDDHIFFSDFSEFHSLHALAAARRGYMNLSSSVGNSNGIQTFFIVKSAPLQRQSITCGINCEEYLRTRLPNYASLLKNLRHLCIKDCH